MFLFALFTLSFGSSIEFFDETDTSYTEIHRQYSKLQYKERSGDEVLQLANFGKVADIFKGCLVHLINYNYIDLKPMSHPFVLSRYDVVKNVYWVNNVFTKQINKPLLSSRYRLFNYANIPKNGTRLEWCKRSRLDMECLDTISFIDNSASTKPWKCEAHLYLFPPNDPSFYEMASVSGSIRLLVPGPFKRLFWAVSKARINIRDGYTEDVLLVNRPRFDILLNIKSSELQNYWVRSMSEYAPNWYDIVANTAKELLTVQLLYSARNPALLGPKRLFVNTLFLLCRSCNSQKSLQPLNIGLFKNLKNLTKYLILINKLNTDNIVYKIWPLGEALVNGFVADNYKLPTTSNRHKLNNLIQSKGLPLTELRWEIEARMLGDVLPNSSFRLFPFACKKGYPLACNDLYQPIIYIVSSGNIEYTHFQLHRKSLTFVSCGMHEHTGLGYQHLVSIFDIYVWLGIVASVFSVAGFCTFVQMYPSVPKPGPKFSVSNYFFPNLMSYYKVLIEQGDPICNQLWNIPHLGYTFACFLFAAVVITNGYKNENITQLTLPRANIPYDQFSTLISKNFTIYTRATLIGGFYECKVLALPFLHNIFKFIHKFHNHYENITGHHLTTLFQSEVHLFGHAQVSLRRFFLPVSNFSQAATRLMNHTQIVPNWQVLYYDVTGKCSLFDSKNDRNLCDPLKLCNNKALMLPELEAHTKYYLLKRAGLNAFMGRESLIENQFGIVLARWVHPLILERMKGLYASGALGWWDRFIIKFLTRLRVGFYGVDADTVSAANLRGNIVVVFTVLPVGILLGIAVFLKEIGVVDKSMLRIAKGKRHVHKHFNFKSSEAIHLN